MVVKSNEHWKHHYILGLDSTFDIKLTGGPPKGFRNTKHRFLHSFWFWNWVEQIGRINTSQNFVNWSKIQRADFPTSIASVPGQLVGRNAPEFVPGFTRITRFRFSRNCVPERYWFILSSLIWKYVWASAKRQVLH